ncbi:hypothetical protein [Croceivirga thetidis]|uniref:SRPBCC family protein n=1 Tax=Croceivirga thetidis TaxID=2721623 RepID=A0ABX1GSN1_9FLAO|nr:hypothetical protein [Croceivirga thetidis]NKI32957.1 hypothetical protein [Croceivirga thetidis]
MKVLNVHSRIINQPKSKVVELVETLSTEHDAIWPKEKWPKMKFRGGIQEGAKGGHGPIRYSVEKYDPSTIIQFRFSKPEDFHGIHKFEIWDKSKEKTKIAHTIDMTTSGKGTLLWVFGIRSLHNALIEDAFDKMENHFSSEKKSTPWNLWVRILRSVLA